jgi:hypothetical protein
LFFIGNTRRLRSLDMTVLLGDITRRTSEAFTSFSVSVNGVKRVRVSFSFPLVPVNISIGKAIVLSLSQVRLFRSSSLNVFHLEHVSMRDGSSFLGLGILAKIVNAVSITDELWWVGSYILNLLELILGIERVTRLSSCSEFVLLGLGSENVPVGEVVLRLVQSYFKLKLENKRMTYRYGVDEEQHQ